MLPFLPPEIVLNVIRLSLPPVQYRTFQERYDILLAYSLVNRSWRSMAQGPLFENVWLPDDALTRRLSAAIDGTGLALARGIKTLRVGTPNDYSRAVWKEPWELFPTVLDVLAGCTCLPVEDLAELTTLRRLHLHEVRFKYAIVPPLASFTHLEHLTLSELGDYIDHTFLRLFHPSAFPALHSVTLADRGDGIKCDVIVDAVSAIAPQIRSLAIVDNTMAHEIEEAMLPRLRHFTALQHLVIVGQPENAYDRRPDLYSRIPTSLQSLAIIVHPQEPFNPRSTLLDLLDGLRRDVSSLRKLTRISIPPPTSAPILNSEEPTERWADSTWVALRSLAAQRKIALDESGANGELDAWLPVLTDFLAGSEWY